MTVDIKQKFNPKEAVQLARKVGFISQTDIIDQILNELSRQGKLCSPFALICKDWSVIVALQTIFNTGRVMGIREERARRKKVVKNG